MLIFALCTCIHVHRTRMLPHAARVAPLLLAATSHPVGQSVFLTPEETAPAPVIAAFRVLSERARTDRAQDTAAEQTSDANPETSDVPVRAT